MKEEEKKEVMYTIVDSLIESDIEGIGMIGHDFEYNVLMWYKGKEYKLTIGGS
jgi:hypothetical protein